jgi:hypothetical protein
MGKERMQNGAQQTRFSDQGEQSSRRKTSRRKGDLLDLKSVQKNPSGGGFSVSWMTNTGTGRKVLPV